MKKSLTLFLIVLLCINFSLLAQVKPDGKKAWEHIDYLASNEFKGRLSGTPEYQKAAEYVASKYEEYGLKPGGEKSSWYQQVPFKNWRLFEQPIRLEVVTPEHRKYFAGYGRDYTPVYGTGSGTVKGKLVFAGYGIVKEDVGWNDYANIDVKGKIVLILPGTPETMQKELRSESSTNKKIEKAVEKGAAGAILMNISGGGRRGGSVGKDICPEGFVVMSASRSFLDDVFYLSDLSWRYFVSKTIREKKSVTAGLNVTVEMEAHYIQENRTAPNVIGIIPGNDPELKDQYVVIGGHLDHLGVGVDGFIYNGADDDASGVAVVLEVARVLGANNFKPGRTIVFCSWAGEELGLVGSRYYTNNPVYPLEKTILYMNMDMVGQGDLEMYIGGMYEHEEFYKILKEHIPVHIQEKLRDRQAYRGSDHTAFMQKGVTYISLRSGGLLTRGNLDDEHPEYHKPGDMSNTIEPEVLQQAAEYHIGIIEHMAKCRKPLLDPKFHVNFVHRDATVVDLHCDTIGRFLRGQDLSKDNPRGHIDIPKLKQGCVDLQVFACYVGPPGNDIQKNTAAKRVFNQIDGVYRLVEENSDDLTIVKSYEDMGRIAGARGLEGTGKIGILIGIEGGYAIENDLALLRSFYREGVRLMTLTHWTRTDWADASGDKEAKLGGLTEFGEKVVQEMNKLGMIVDVSHVHDETFWDVIKISKDPVVASHSCARALSDHFRNMNDDMLKALAENDGVIGINYMPGFLNAEIDNKVNDMATALAKKYDLPTDRREIMKADPEKRKKFYAEYREKAKEIRATLPKVDVKTVVDHIDHVVKVTGSTNHVGLGSDFDGISGTPEGLEHTGKIVNITQELFNRGYKDRDIQKILGGNFMRVFRKVCSERR